MSSTIKIVTDSLDSITAKPATTERNNAVTYSTIKIVTTQTASIMGSSTNLGNDVVETTSCSTDLTSNSLIEPTLFIIDTISTDTTTGPTSRYDDDSDWSDTTTVPTSRYDDDSDWFPTVNFDRKVIDNAYDNPYLNYPERPDGTLDLPREIIYTVVDPEPTSTTKPPSGNSEKNNIDDKGFDFLPIILAVAGAAAVAAIIAGLLTYRRRQRMNAMTFENESELGIKTNPLFKGDNYIENPLFGDTKLTVSRMADFNQQTKMSQSLNSLTRSGDYGSANRLNDSQAMSQTSNSSL
jgi:hypothetical protein